MRREKITIGSFVHVYNRGNRKQEIIRQSKDRWHFLEMLYYFNTNSSTGRPFRDLKKTEMERSNLSKQGRNPFVWPGIWPSRKPIVKIMAFCLMPNHYHLLLSPRVEKGIPQFMKKLNAGYAKYFNKKYERVGALFQGRYKQIIVTDDTHFLHMPFYIHFNPLDLSHPEWRENNISDPRKALEFLKSYKWSSHLDYLVIKNFSSILNKKILMEIFESNKDYEKLVENYLKDIQIDKEVVLE